MKFCKFCGKELKDGEACSCQEKPTEKKNSKKATKKSETVKEEYKFCKNCGKKIKVGETCECSKVETIVTTNDIGSIIKETFTNAMELVKHPITTIKKLHNEKDMKYSLIASSVYSLIISIILSFVFKKVIEDGVAMLSMFSYNSMANNVDINMFRLIITLFISSYILILLFTLGILGACKLFKVETDFTKCLSISSSIAVASVVASVVAILYMLFGSYTLLYGALLVASICINVGLVLSLKEIVKVENDKVLYVTLVTMLIFDILIYVVSKLAGSIF